MSILKKILCYIGGLLIIAVGINISKLSNLGISPVSSIPRACEVIWGFSLGNATKIIYCVLILLQIAVLRRNFKPMALLGFVISIGFGYMVDFVGINPNTFGHLLAWLPKPANIAAQLGYLALSMFTIGVGVYLYLRPKWVPMPAEGLAKAISDVSGKAFGDCKSAVDCSMITIALLLQLVFLGGFSSFLDKERVVVNIGTVLSAVCIGQIVKMLSRLLAKKN